MKPASLYWNTATPLLKSCLTRLMKAKPFGAFRLVGGTALSLQLGHRLSEDIDLFSDAAYGSIDFEAIDQYLRHTFVYADKSGPGITGIGVSYYIGHDRDDCIKLDIYYTDPFIQPVFYKEGIRLATLEEIIAMKMDTVSRGGRKKDFWDIHELLDKYTIAQMIKLHNQRYHYSHDPALLLNKLVDFTPADDDFEPVCLRGKHWELIRLDIRDAVNM